MSTVLLPGFTAVVFGVLAAILLFVPFLALQYRRRGTLTPGALVLGFGVLVYSLSLATYTLLPLPEVTPALCASGGSGAQLVPGRFIADVIRENEGGLAGLPSNRALLQVLLNVGLFVPLGVIVRALFRRGILITTLIALGVSLFIELTQLTGVWFLFPCSYRLFDVDDLVANTAGAVLGALVAPVFARVSRTRSADPETPRPVRAPRRLLGMLSDVGFVLIGGGTLAVAFSTVVVLADIGVDPDVKTTVETLLSTVAPAAVQLVVVLRTRRTIGEWTVRLRPRTRGGTGRALLRWLLGIGGYSVLVASGSVFTLFALVTATIVMTLTTRRHRGLSYVAAGWELEDDRGGTDVATTP